MKILFLISLLITLCNQEVKTISLNMPNNFKGWVFVIENDKKAVEVNGVYSVDRSGVVYIPCNTNGEKFKFRLVTSDIVDVSKNAKLFHKSVYAEFDNNKTKRNFYNFYYPSTQEMKLRDEIWQDIEFFEKYNMNGLRRQEELEKGGYFD